LNKLIGTKGVTHMGNEGSPETP